MSLSQAKLTPADEIKIYYKASPELERIIKEFSEYIILTIKQPLSPYPVALSENIIITESNSVSMSGFSYNPYSKEKDLNKVLFMLFCVYMYACEKITEV